jgi:protease IV
MILRRCGAVIKTCWRIMMWSLRALMRLLSALFLLAFIASIAVMVWTFRDVAHPPHVAPETVLVVRLDGLILDAPPVDVATQRLMGEQVQTVQELIQTLRKAAADDRIIALLLKPGSYYLNLTNALDVREELLAFRRAGKRIFAYAETLGMGNYLLASAADHIFMPPSGATYVMGLRAEVAFYGELFQKLGVTPEFTAIGSYKLAPQVLTMDHMSEEFQEVLNDELDAYYAAYVQHVAEARQVSALLVREWIDDALYTPHEALAAGMIDAMVYESQLEQRLAEELGLARDAGEGEDSGEPVDDGGASLVDDDEHAITPPDNRSPLTTLTIAEYRAVDVEAPRLHLAGEKIAVVYATGTITMGRSSPTPTRPSIGSQSFGDLFASLADNDEIRGIIVRIDSGGGGVMASDILRNSLREARAKKPVVVSMADVAASGGYMIALPADRIVAHPLTLTGSIGIFGGKFSLEGLSEMAGVRVETLQRGQNAGLFTTSRPRTPEEHERFRTYLQQRYDEFVDHVAEGRGLTTDVAHDAAQGRVWLGTQALELGLVDALGGLDTAIDVIKELLDIPEHEDIMLVAYPRAGSPLEILRQRFGGWMTTTAPAGVQAIHHHLETLTRLQHEQVLAWWPVRIQID